MHSCNWDFISLPAWILLRPHKFLEHEENTDYKIMTNTYVNKPLDIISYRRNTTKKVVIEVHLLSCQAEIVATLTEKVLVVVCNDGETSKQMLMFHHWKLLKKLSQYFEMFFNLSEELMYLENSEITYQVQKLELVQTKFPRYLMPILFSSEMLLGESEWFSVTFKASMSSIFLKT